MSALASSVILPGEEILSEHPVIMNKVINDADFRADTEHIWPEFNQTLLDSLPINSQKEVKRLAATVGGPDFTSSALSTNQFLVEINNVKHSALLPMVSRLNHDCRPKWVHLHVFSSFELIYITSVAYTFSQNTLTMSLRTLRRVEANEELTISYIPSDRMTTQDRIKRLDAWGFRCLCHQCTMRKYLADESDHRIEIFRGVQKELEALWKRVKDADETGPTVDYDEVHEQVEYLVTLIQQERIFQALSRAYTLGARILSRSSFHQLQTGHPSNTRSVPQGQPPLTPDQIYIILKYITLAVESGLATFGESFGSSYNQLIRIERDMHEMLVQWDRIRLQHS